MKRNLLKQMRNEWRDNVWLLIELVVVCLSIWILCVMFYFRASGLLIPKGFNTDNVYSISSKWVQKDNPNYQSTDDKGQYYDDLRQLLQQLRRNPNVEYVATHNAALPYNYNYSGWQVNVVDEDDSIIYGGNVRWGSPDVVKVLGYESITGSTSDQLVSMLERGEILLGTNDEYKEKGRDVLDLKGKMIFLNGDTAKLYRVGDIIHKVRRTDYENSYGGSIIMPKDESTNDIWGNIVVRVKPGKGRAFEEDFKNNPSMRKLRNVYLSNLKRVDDIKEACQRSVEINLRMYAVVIGFLLVTVFLGLLGTFWFRIQQRVGEIALRKVCGATRSQLFRRIISEGLILLATAVLIVSGFVYGFHSKFEELIPGLVWTPIIVIELVMITMVAIGIVISLYYPARKAMNIEPAIAVKEE